MSCRYAIQMRYVPLLKYSLYYIGMNSLILIFIFYSCVSFWTILSWNFVPSRSPKTIPLKFSNQNPNILCSIFGYWTELFKRLVEHVKFWTKMSRWTIKVGKNCYLVEISPKYSSIRGVEHFKIFDLAYVTLLNSCDLNSTRIRFNCILFC